MGYGMGLHFARLGALMGQAIRESEPGRASRSVFTVRLQPIRPATRAGGGAGEPDVLPRNSDLLAEDNRVNRQWAVRLLEQAGTGGSRGHRPGGSGGGQPGLVFRPVLMESRCPKWTVSRRQCHPELEQPRASRIPIVADDPLLKGDRERCMAAGRTAMWPSPAAGRTLPCHHEAVAQARA